MRAFGKYLFLLTVGLVLGGCVSSVTIPRTGKVAVLLPLSGNLASWGGGMRNAVTMALNDNAGQVEVQFFDTAGTEAGALAAGQAARAFGAELVLGPLVGRNIESARRGLGSGPAIVSFSNDISKAKANNFIFNVTPANSTQRILEYAAQTGKTNVGILYPDNELGQVSVQAATGAAQTLGLTIVAALPYSADAGREGAASRQAAAQLMAEKKDEIDALLLPDSGGKLREIATLSFFYELEPKTEAYLGTHLMDDASLTTEPALNGAHFSAISESLDLFETRFATNFGAAPRLTAVAAYDAMSMAASLLEVGQGLSARTLTNPNGFRGVLGTYRLNADGTTQRLMAIKTVGPNGVEVVVPAARSFLF